MPPRKKGKSSASVPKSAASNTKAKSGKPAPTQTPASRTHGARTRAYEKEHGPQEALERQYQAAEGLRYFERRKQEVEYIIDGYGHATNAVEYKALVEKGFKERSEGDVTLWMALTHPPRIANTPIFHSVKLHAQQSHHTPADFIRHPVESPVFLCCPFRLWSPRDFLLRSKSLK